jgi:hypothetical protein
MTRKAIKVSNVFESSAYLDLHFEGVYIYDDFNIAKPLLGKDKREIITI